MGASQVGQEGLSSLTEDTDGQGHDGDWGRGKDRGERRGAKTNDNDLRQGHLVLASKRTPVVSGTHGGRNYFGRVLG